MFPRTAVNSCPILHVINHILSDIMLCDSCRTNWRRLCHKSRRSSKYVSLRDIFLTSWLHHPCLGNLLLLVLKRSNWSFNAISLHATLAQEQQRNFLVERDWEGFSCCHEISGRRVKVVYVSRCVLINNPWSTGFLSQDSFIFSLIRVETSSGKSCLQIKSVDQKGSLSRHPFWLPH